MYRIISKYELDFNPRTMTISPTTKQNLPLESKYSEIQLNIAEFRGLSREKLYQ